MQRSNFKINEKNSYTIAMTNDFFERISSKASYIISNKYDAKSIGLACSEFSYLDLICNLLKQFNLISLYKKKIIFNYNTISLDLLIDFNIH